MGVSLLSLGSKQKSRQTKRIGICVQTHPAMNLTLTTIKNLSELCVYFVETREFERLLIQECFSDFYLLLSARLSFFKNTRCSIKDVMLYLPGVPGEAGVGSAGDLRAKAVGRKAVTV